MGIADVSAESFIRIMSIRWRSYTGDIEIPNETSPRMVQIQQKPKNAPGTVREAYYVCVRHYVYPIPISTGFIPTAEITGI